MEKVDTTDITLDKEWLELIKRAKEMGLTQADIRAFLRVKKEPE